MKIINAILAWWKKIMSKIGRGNPFPPDSPTIGLALTTLNLAEGSTNNITVTRTSSTLASSCLLYTKPGTAGDADFTAHNGTLVSFSSGETSKVVPLVIASDGLSEGNESFGVYVANPVNAVIGNRELIVTINGESAPAPVVVNVTSAAANEGDVIEHIVTMSSDAAATIAFLITNITVSTDDYNPTIEFTNGVVRSGDNLIKPAGVSNFKIRVHTIEDLVVEPNETYGFTVGGFPATGTIINDDAVVVVSISSPTVTEGGLATWHVSLSGTSIGQTFTFASGGTATPGVDYAQPFTFTPGVSKIDNTLSVSAGLSGFDISTLITDDADIEANETAIITVGGVAGTLTIVDNDTPPVTLAALTKIVPFEMPYGMLNSGQKTAAATSGGYAAFAVSRDSNDAANYDIDMSTSADGTYTTVAENVLFTPSGLLVGSVNPDHRTISVRDEKDFPTSISETTIGLIADTAGQQEHCLLNAYNLYEVGDDSEKVLENIGVACFDSTPITVHQNETARVFVLTNYGLYTTLIAHGVTLYFKLVPKDSAGTRLALSEITPVSLTITSRASKPYPPRKVEFKAEEDADYETYPGRILPFDDLLMRISTASKTGETTPFSFWNPSGLNEATVTYHADVIGVDGAVVRTINFSGGLATYGSFDHGEDIQQAITEYRFYAKKGSVKSAEVIVNVQQQVRGTYPEVASVAIAQSGSNINVTITFDRTRAYYFGVDYLITGTAISEATLGAISVGTGGTLIENNRIKISPTTSSVVLTIAKGTATGKDITVAVGNDNSMQDDTHTIV